MRVLVEINPLLAQTSPGLPSSGESVYYKHMRRCDTDDTEDYECRLVESRRGLDQKQV